MYMYCTGGTAEALSTNCVVHIEDCWLSSGCSSVIKDQHLKPGDLGLIPGHCQLFTSLSESR